MSIQKILKKLNKKFPEGFKITFETNGDYSISLNKDDQWNTTYRGKLQDLIYQLNLMN
jgi:organic radical activating enzyme